MAALDNANPIIHQVQPHSSAVRRDAAQHGGGGAAEFGSADDGSDGFDATQLPFLSSAKVFPPSAFSLHPSSAPSLVSFFPVASSHPLSSSESPLGLSPPLPSCPPSPPPGVARDPWDNVEVFELIRRINDPEHPLTLEQLNVLQLPLLKVDDEGNSVDLRFTPTIPHCSMATLIGLCLRVQLLRSLPPRFKVDIRITEGAHSTEEASQRTAPAPQHTAQRRPPLALSTPRVPTHVGSRSPLSPQPRSSTTSSTARCDPPALPLIGCTAVRLCSAAAALCSQQAAGGQGARGCGAGELAPLGARQPLPPHSHRGGGGR